MPHTVMIECGCARQRNKKHNSLTMNLLPPPQDNKESQNSGTIDFVVSFFISSHDYRSTNCL